MSGSVSGGKKAAQTNKRKYGENFYANIGAKGGRNGNTGGFASNLVGKDGLTGKERAKIAGAKGGRAGRRGPATAKKAVAKKPAVKKPVVKAEPIVEEPKKKFRWPWSKK